MSKMIQLGRFDSFSFALTQIETINDSMFHGLSKVWDIAGKVSNGKFNKIVDVANIYRKMSKDEFDKRFRGSGVTLTNNEMKYIIKVVIGNREV